MHGMISQRSTLIDHAWPHRGLLVPDPSHQHSLPRGQFFHSFVTFRNHQVCCLDHRGCSRKLLLRRILLPFLLGHFPTTFAVRTGYLFHVGDGIWRHGLYTKVIGQDILPHYFRHLGILNESSHRRTRAVVSTLVVFSKGRHRQAPQVGSAILNWS